MPELRADEIKALVQSLAQYSESSVLAAIEAAKDPDVANQFAAYIGQGLDDSTLADFTEIGLCIALSEARAVNAIPVMLRMATSNEWNMEIYNDAAIYALQRMGKPAFEGAMRFIEQPHEEAIERIGAYIVLEAAIDEDVDADIAPIADFCAWQMSIEGPALRNEDNNVAWNCCHNLVLFHDQRVRPWLVEFSEDPEFRDMLEMLDAGTTPTLDFNWRDPWPEMCAEWAEKVAEQFDDLPDVDEDVDEIIDPEITERVQQFKGLVDEFTSGLTDEELGSLPIDPDNLMEMYDFGLRKIGMTFDFTDKGQLHNLLYDVLIRNLSVGSEYFAQLPDLIGRFIQFLHRTNRLDDPEPLMQMLQEARVDLPRLNDDPNNWGMTKMFVNGGIAAGFDMTTEEGIGQYTEVFSKKAAQRQFESEQAEESMGHTPFRREAPKVGRNDPCPCGSGKKYKKCCGK